jgi:hypothetical protein
MFCLIGSGMRRAIRGFQQSTKALTASATDENQQALNTFRNQPLFSLV